MQNEESELIYCKNHPTKLAKRFCSNSTCNMLICNSCALESHSSHLDKLQNINSLYVQSSESLTKILQLSKNTLRGKSNIMFKCMNFVFHQAKMYCKECKNYVCDKCLVTHEKGHTLMSLSHFLDDFTNTIECFMTIISYDGKENLIEGEKVEEGNLEGKEDIDEMIFDLVRFKKEINEKFMKRNGFLLKIMADFHKFFIRKHNQLSKNKGVFKQLSTLYDKLKLEKDNMKMIGFYIEYQMIIENLYGSSKEKAELITAYKKLKEIREIVRKYNKEANVIVKEKVLSNIKDRIKETNELLKKNDSDMKTEICALANMTADSYDKVYNNNEKEPESSYNTFEGSRKYILDNYQYVQGETTGDIQPQPPQQEVPTSSNQTPVIQQGIIEVVVEKQVIVEKPVYVEKQVIVEKPVYVEKQVIVEKPVYVEKQIIVEKPVYVEKQVVVEKAVMVEKQVIVEKPFIVEKQVVFEKIIEKPAKVIQKDEPTEKEKEVFAEKVVEKIVEVMKTRFNDLTLKSSDSIEYIQQPKEPQVTIQTEIKEVIKEVHIPPVKAETNEIGTQSDDIKEKKDDKIFEGEAIVEGQEGIVKGEEVSGNQKDLIEENTEEQVMKNEEQEQQINEEDKKEVIQQQEEILIAQTKENQIEDQEVKTKQEPEQEQIQEIEKPQEEDGGEEETPTLESIAPKLVFLNSKIAIGGTSEEKVKELLATLTWDERNLIEIIGLGQNCKTAFIFNPYLNKIEEIELERKLPTFHSYLNLESYVFLSGGKNTETNTDVTDFCQMKRQSEKEFEYYDLEPMKTARSYHSMVHVEKINCICVISGSRLKSCEKYSFEEKEWSELPPLSSSREKPCVCVINEGLYVFFGFDRTISKYVTTIERLDLNQLDKWEQIVVPGNQNIIKKQGLSYFNHPTQEGIILVGGINSLRNESKEVLYFDPIKNTVIPFTSSLPNIASFTHGKFFKLFDNYYNLTENLSVTVYESKSGKFTNI